MEKFYQKCAEIIASRTQRMAARLCYYPLGWRLDTWHDFIDDDMKENLPEVPQLDHLLDPYQGATKAVKAGVNREDTSRASQSSQLSGRTLEDKPGDSPIIGGLDPEVRNVPRKVQVEIHPRKKQRRKEVPEPSGELSTKSSVVISPDPRHLSFLSSPLPESGVVEVSGTQRFSVISAAEFVR